METNLSQLISHYKALGVDQQIDYDKFYLYSIITHSTAIEGSTITEVENRLLFDEGISAHGKSMTEQLMNIDLKEAYIEAMAMAARHEDLSVDMLCHLSAIVMCHTGGEYSTPLGNFSAAKGELRLLNVSAGFGGRSYLSYQKVRPYLENFCKNINKARHEANLNDIEALYNLSFDAHYQLVTIHPWIDGNGRMSRLIMNYIQFEFGLVPSKVDKDTKPEYIRALEQSRDEENMLPFRNFMMEHHLHNLQTINDEYSASTIAEPDFIWGRSGHKSDQKSDQKILDAIRGNAHITIRELHETTGLSESGVKKILRQLREKGSIRRVGSDKGGHWETL